MLLVVGVLVAVVAIQAQWDLEIHHLQHLVRVVMVVPVPLVLSMLVGEVVELAQRAEQHLDQLPLRGEPALAAL